MANIHACRDRLAQRALSRLGKALFVKGIEYMAIIVDDEYEDETGKKRELTASFDYQHANIIKVDDPVVLDGVLYKVSQKQRENTVDQFHTVELKRA